MASTPERNISYPDPTTGYNPPVDWANTANSVENALVEGANYGVGTTAQMNAAIGRYPDGAMWRNTSNNTEFRRVDGIWVSQNSDGWVTVSVPGGWTVNNAVQVRKIGQVVYWRGRVTPNSAGSGSREVLPAGRVPEWARPSDVYAAMRPLVSHFGSTSIDGRVKAGAVYPDGSISVFVGASNSDPIVLAGLSGYLVD